MIRALALLAGLLTLTACTRATPADELSVVLVTLDTTRADRLGPYGGDVPTPTLDEIAADGVVFEQAYTQVPLTLPAHASILTGRYPATHGVRHNGIYRLGSQEKTLAEVLRGRGFATAGFVAAYVLNRGFGLEQGFDVFDDVPVDRYAGGQDQVFRAERSGDEVNARVFEWLRRPPEGRFFLWVHYYDPHDPYEPPERPGRTLHGQGYDREISYLDAVLGDLLARLRQGGMLDRSVLVVAGDHGESLGEHGERTHGVFLYEGAVHVPLLVRAPGHLTGGTRVRGPVELVDIPATLLDLLGVEAPRDLEGRSLARLARREEERSGRVARAETLMPRLEFGWSELRMAHDGRFKYIEAPVPELYDLRADPGETRNLAANEAERRQELAAALAGWASPATDEGPAQTLSAEEQARLASLGYLTSGVAPDQPAGGAPRPDPKAMMPEVRALDAARERLAQGDAAGALAGADAILARNPRNHQARATRVLALIELRRLVEAQDEAHRALAEATGDPGASQVLVEKARGLLASAYMLAGDDAAAEAQYRRMLEADPHNDAAAVDLARLLVRRGHLAEAEARLRDVLARDPRNGMALAARFLLEEARGDGAAMLDTAGALARARAGDPPVLRRAAQVLLRAGRAPEAVACLEVAQEQVELDADLLRQLAAARIQAGQLERARDELRAALSLRPRDPRPHHLLGTIALRQGKEAEARAHFEAAMSASPRFTAPLLSLGRWLASQGRRAEAIATVEEAVRRDPSDQRAATLLRELRGG